MFSPHKLAASKEQQQSLAHNAAAEIAILMRADFTHFVA